MSWYLSAILSALSASLVAILGKLGLKTVDSTLATTIRSFVMALFLLLVSLLMGKFTHLTKTSIGTNDWILIILAGVAGAVSWLFYFYALKSGPASGVSALDRLSLVFVVLFAAIFLSEHIGWKTVVGVLLMVIGAFFITAK